MNNVKGFTLIELMIVIVLIGVLLSLSFPKIFGLSAKTKVAEVLTIISGFEHLQQSYITENSNLGSLSSIGFELTKKSVNFNYISNTPGFIEVYLLNSINDDCNPIVGGLNRGWKSKVFLTTLINRENAKGGCGLLTPNFE